MSGDVSKPFFPIILAGLATTGLTLFGIYLLDVSGSDFNIMGWYANRIIPVGAFLVGLVAASGYGIVSYLMGFKISKWLLWAVLGLQLVAYCVAQYVTYTGLDLTFDTPTGPHRMSFVEYFDISTRMFAFKNKSTGMPGTPLGAWGYGIRLLEVIGFVGGSLVVPGALRSMPYCDRCQRYMKTKSLAVIPLSIPSRRVKKSDVDAQNAYAAEQKAAVDGGEATLAQLLELASTGQAGAFKDRLKELAGQRKKAVALPTRLGFDLVSCADCAQGYFKVSLITGQGRDTRQTERSRTEVSPEFVRAFRSS